MRSKERLEDRNPIILRPYKSDLKAFDKACGNTLRTKVIYKLMERFSNGEFGDDILGKRIILCNECDSVIANDSFPTKIKVLKKGHFCCEGCRHVFLEREKDEAIDKDYIKEIEEVAYENGKEDGKNEEEEKNKVEKEKVYDDGFFSGMFEGMKLSKMCVRCKVKMAESVHHIIPRKNGGKNNIENLILLCTDCHNFVEIKTGELFQEKDIGLDELKNYIVTNSFPSKFGYWKD